MSPCPQTADCPGTVALVPGHPVESPGGVCHCGVGIGGAQSELITTGLQSASQI